MTGEGPATGGAAPLKRRALAALAASALTLLGVELAVGRFYPVLGQVYRLDPSLLHDTIPGSRRIQPMEPRRLREGDVARVLVEIDGGGFRGRGPLGDGKRVLVLGDSFVMAENVPLESTFVQQLANGLGERLGQELIGINAGRSGYGPDQSLLLLERVMGDVAPDLVVCVLCAHNDLGDLARNKLFRLDAAGGLERCSPRIGARLTDEFARRGERSSALGIRRLVEFWREAPSRRPVDRVPAGTIDLYLAALTAQFDEFFVRGDLEVVSLFEDVYDADGAIRPRSVPVATKAALMTEVLRAMVELAGEQDVPIHFVVVPSAVDVDPGFGIRVDPARFPAYSPEALGRLLVRAVDEAGGVVSDLTQRLREEGTRAWVGGTDIHWNAVGQRIGAGQVAAELASRPEVTNSLGGG